MNATRTIYNGHTANWPVLIFSVALSVPLVVIALANGAALLSNLLVASLIALLVVSSVLTSSSLRSTIGPTGVSVRFGVFGFPRFHWSLEQIERAEPVEISPWDQMFGIWWSPLTGLKLSLRSGTAIRLTLTSGRHVTFNVEDSTAAIAALEAAGNP
ncbi:MAG: hypothetical protein HYX29_03770 [Solirubrobacterales bacterium]|nr:hypothetical protein [Solirubrobacterales bacterium]